MNKRFFTYCTGGTICWPEKITTRVLLEYLGGDFQIILDNCEYARQDCAANSDEMAYISLIANNAECSCRFIQDTLAAELPVLNWDHILRDKDGNTIAFFADASGCLGPRMIAVPDQAYKNHPEIFELFIEFIKKLEALREKESHHG